MGTQSTAFIKPATEELPGGVSSFLKTLLGRCGLIALNAITGIMAARTLKPSGRGELAAMILWPVFLSQMFTFGMPSAVLYSLRRGKFLSRTLVGTGLIFALIVNIAITLFGVFLIPHWLNHYSPEVIRMAQWLMLSTPLAGISMVGRSALEARGRFGSSSIVGVCSPALTAVALLVLIMTHRLTPYSAALSYVISGVPPVLIVLNALSAELIPEWKNSIAAARDLLSYGLRSYGIDLCGTLSQYVDQALVVGILNPSAMGSYTVALSLSRTIGVVFNSVAAVLFPKTMNRDLDFSISLSLRALLGSLVVTAPAALALVFGGRLALQILYGHEYAVAQVMLEILVLEAIVSGSINVMSQIFMAIGRPGTVTVLQAIGLSLSIPLMMIMVPRWGGEGAAFALLLSAILRGGLLIFSYRRLPLHRTLPFGVRLKLETRVLVDSCSHQWRKLVGEMRTSNSAQHLRIADALPRKDGEI
jgi:O-antigen/teichoic acid export membrane protein